MEREYSDYIKIFKDAPKMLENRIGISFVIGDLNIMKNKRITGNFAVYAKELMAILMALLWVEEVGASRVLVCSG